jgi:tetratricopeptide (TPR) repeat protein
MNLATMFSKAVKSYQAGSPEKAEKLCRQVLKQMPDHAAALNLLGIIAQHLGHHAAAAEMIKQAIKCNPSSSVFYFNLGNVYWAQGLVDEAIAAYREAIQRDPSSVDACNNLSIVLQAVGRLDEALDASSRALKLRPGFVVAGYNQGNILKALDRLDEAVAAYQWVLKLKPDYVDAWLNLGNTFKSLNELDQSIDAYQHALALNKDYAEAWFNLGDAYQKSMQHHNAVLAFRRARQLQPDNAVVCFAFGHACEKSCDYEGAVDAYRHGVKLEPGSMAGYLKLANAFSLLGDLDNALQVYNDMRSIEPDNVEAWLNMGHVLSSMGDFVAAEAAFRQVLQRNPRSGGAYYLLSLIKKFTPDDVDKQAMLDVLQYQGLEDEDRLFTCFALSKACEDSKEYDRSFQNLLEANRLSRKLYDYDIAVDKARFLMIKKTFTQSFFAQRRDYGVSDETPVFIVGMLRSGTTLVEQILSSHPAVCGAGELNDLHQLLFRVGGNHGPIMALSRDDSVSLADEYLRRLSRFSAGVSHVTDKMPANFIYIGMIRLLFPRAKIIHCKRDPLDTCVSIFKQYFSGQHKYAYDLEELGQYYSLYRDLMAHWHSVLPGYIHDVEYETLIAGQEDETRKLLDFCALPWDDACLSFYKHDRSIQTASLAQVRQPIYKDSIEKWRRYERYLGPLLHALEKEPYAG